MFSIVYQKQLLSEIDTGHRFSNVAYIKILQGSSAVHLVESSAMNRVKAISLDDSAGDGMHHSRICVCVESCAVSSIHQHLGVVKM